MSFQKNLYCIYAKTFDLVEDKISNIIEKTADKSIQFQTKIYDQKDFESMSEILADLKTSNLFSTAKIIIKINSFSAIPGKKLKALIEAFQITKNWVFIWYNNEKNKGIKNENIKNLFKFFVIANFGLVQKRTLVSNFFKQKNYLISQETLNFLIDKLPNSMIWIKNELKKIEIYYSTYQKVIDFPTVSRLIYISPSEKFFELIEAIIQDNKIKMVNEYKKLDWSETNPLHLLATIETYLLTLEKVLVLKKQNKSANEAALILQKNRFFIYKLFSLSSFLNQSKIYKLIKRLIFLEKKLKTSPISSNVLFESFLVS